MKFKIKVISYDLNYFNYFINLFYKLFLILGVFLVGPIFLPTTIYRFNILRSPNSDKDHRDQLAIKLYSGFIIFRINKYNILEYLMLINISSMVKIYLSYYD